MTKAFACYNKDDKIRMKSSSGGIYYLIAQNIISDGGVVYGACYEGTDVCHRRIETLDGISASCGSKYQPSVLGRTFNRVKEDLDDGRKVLFSGTPCQCAGLLAMLGEHENLYCMDFICHGIPSKAAWREYLSSLKKRGAEIISVNMRDKISGWSKYSWRLSGIDGKEIIEPAMKNAFMKGFLADIYLRPSCYQCCFKGIERKTDMTLGDYWGVQNIQPEMFDNKGTSLFFVHSNKGMKLFQKISEQMEYTMADIKRATRANPSLLNSSECPLEREQFFQKMKKQDFIQLIQSLTKVPLYKQIERKVKNMVNIICGGGDEYLTCIQSFDVTDIREVAA